MRRGLVPRPRLWERLDRGAEVKLTLVSAPAGFGTTSAPLLVDLPAQLVGPRVRVRPYEEADWPALWEAIEASRTHLAPWMGWIGRYTAPDHALVHLRAAAPAGSHVNS